MNEREWYRPNINVIECRREGVEEDDWKRIVLTEEQRTDIESYVAKRLEKEITELCQT
jgi:hypothetical protein